MPMHKLDINRARIVHKATMIVGINMKYESTNFMRVARENQLLFEHEQWHVSATEPWNIFVWVCLVYTGYSVEEEYLPYKQ